MVAPPIPKPRPFDRIESEHTQPLAWTRRLTDTQRAILEQCTAAPAGELIRFDLRAALEIPDPIVSTAIRHLQILGLVDLSTSDGERITIEMPRRHVRYIVITDLGRTALTSLADGHLPHELAEPLPGWCSPFLAALREVPNVARAARIAGVARTTPERVRRRIPAFALAWDEAAAVGRATLAPGTSYRDAEALQLTLQRRFSARCAATDEANSWPIDYSRAFCHALVEKGLYPGAYVRLILALHPDRKFAGVNAEANNWVNGKLVPHKSTAARAERDLYLPPGQLSQYAGHGGQVTSKRMRDIWRKRTRSADNLTKRRHRFLKGHYDRGVDMAARLEIMRANSHVPLKHRRTFRNRLRVALWRMVNNTVGYLVYTDCDVCHRPLIQQRDRLAAMGARVHSDCRKTLRTTHRNLRELLPHKHGASSEERIRLVILHDGLGKSLRKIADIHTTPGTLDPLRSVETRIAAGRTALLGMSWGKLFPAHVPPTSIHRQLGHLPVAEVLAVGVGTHPLADQTEDEALERLEAATQTAQ